MNRAAAAVTFLLAVLCAGAASGQETRADLLQQERAARAAALKPYEPSALEVWMLRIEDERWPERIFNPPRGIFARFGGLPEGAGFAGGPAYRWSTDVVSLTTTSVASMRGYWEVDGSVAFPRLAGGRAFAQVGGRRRDFPQEDFFGLGPASVSSARTSFALRSTSVDASAGVTFMRKISLAASAERIAPRIGHGRDPRMPSIEELFSDPTAPGLAMQPNFVRAGARATVDYIDAPFGSGLGGRYTVSYDSYADRAAGRYSFDRWDVDLQQYVPIVHNVRTLALRAHVASLTPRDGHEVPFYLQPTLGGGYSLRGLRAYRLRDRNLLLLQAEYRWQVNPFVTGVMFYDAGKVAARRGDLDLDDLTDDYGIGVRLGYAGQAALRAEFAFGSGEGTRLLLKFSNVF